MSLTAAGWLASWDETPLTQTLPSSFTLTLPLNPEPLLPAAQLEALLQRFPEAKDILQPEETEEALRRVLNGRGGSRGNLMQMEEEKTMVLIQVGGEGGQQGVGVGGVLSSGRGQ